MYSFSVEMGQLWQEIWGISYVYILVGSSVKMGLFWLVWSFKEERPFILDTFLLEGKLFIYLRYLNVN